MNNAELIYQVNEAIKELQGILAKKKDEELSQLEIDLSLDKLKRIYDIVLKLKPISAVDVGFNPIEKEIKEPDSKKMNVKEESVFIMDESIHELEIETTEIETDEILIPTPALPIEKIKEPKIEPEKETIKAGDVLDLFNENKVLKENEPPVEKKTVADILQKSKLKSIKSAIGINEKFYFLNELFGGDLQTYNNNIEKLDLQNTHEEAIIVLNELAELFNWNKESEAVELLTQMLRNKFN